MLVEVIVKDLPYVGKRGAVKEVPDPETNALLLLGKVKVYEPPNEPVKRVYRKKSKTTKKRTYKTRAIVANEGFTAESSSISVEDDEPESTE